ncbi:NAD-dependent epimerase/dehydratase family protein [Phenylobacterium sp.]|uniref:NAD-dependent epimerase/dehydratase family protein n=1 Tax=Phenylobacterium sp. TaxID=1871053 RepID=UPI0019A57193|nr:NAD-dependent epimerase/dehydratase family protein [Phenylobacterium sp.]MBC7165771.1 NAD-dependent epimerase/dehydratase family protein [Phenylobacterium sp.]
MSRFTVIGARGFIGGRLSAALRARGDSVYAPARDDAELFDQDLGTVFYCAGLTGDFHVRPFDTVEAHVGFVTQVLKRGRFERLIYLSSTRVYDSLGEAGGDEADRLVFDPAAARNVYDLSKALGENLTLARSDSRGVVARLSNVFDWTPDAGGFLSDLLARARRERSIDLPASAPAAVRDYIQADDVVAGLIAMADGRAEGIVNLASGRNLSNRELAAVFAQAGWSLTLGEDRPVPPAPRCATARMRSLGVAPRDPAAVIAQALADPQFFQG